MNFNRRNFLKGASLAAAMPSVAVASNLVGSEEASPRSETDVLVVGGGPAGVCAAIAAARNGAKTMVVEQSGMLGGMATQGVFLG